MINDEFSGQGGTYLFDPATGKRTLLKRTVPAGTAAVVTQDVKAEAEPAAPVSPDPTAEPAN